MTVAKPRISVCIPHWQAELYMTLCLLDPQALRQVRPGSNRRRQWLARRKSLVSPPRPVDPLVGTVRREADQLARHVFTAWDLGLTVATGDYFLSMHSDVFVRSDDWLDPFLREITAGPAIAGTGSWKLEIENPLYAWQKRTIGYAVAKLKSAIGVGKKVEWQQQNYPRDYCALYRRQVLVDHGLTFCGKTGGGISIAQQLWNAGFSTPLFPVREMAKCVYHIAHGTAAIAPEKRLNHARKQKQTERKLARLLEADWITRPANRLDARRVRFGRAQNTEPPVRRPRAARNGTRGRNSQVDCGPRRRDDLIRTAIRRCRFRCSARSRSGAESVPVPRSVQKAQDARPVPILG